MFKNAFKAYWNKKTERQKGVFAFSAFFGYCMAAVACISKPPGNHVSILLKWNGEPVEDVMYDDKMFFVYNPLTRSPYHFRVLPVRKKLVREYKTSDDKNIEVVTNVRLEPKIPYIIDIYKIFGKDYGKKFLEREVNTDLEEVIKHYTYESLIQQDLDADAAASEVRKRVEEACAFHKIILSDMTLVFRDPDAEDEY